MSGEVIEEVGVGDTFVVANAEIMCSFGKMTSIMDTPGHGTDMDGMKQLNINDYEVGVNILPFDLCNCPNNPEVVAEIAKMGRPLEEDEFPPVQCKPVITTPWINGKGNKLVGGAPAMVHICSNTCIYGGEITIVDDGQ